MNAVGLWKAKLLLESSVPLPAYISERKFEVWGEAWREQTECYDTMDNMIGKFFGARKTQFSRRHKNFLAGEKDDDKVEPKSQHCRVVINSLLRQFNENFEIEEDLDSCHPRSRQNNDYE